MDAILNVIRIFDLEIVIRAQIWQMWGPEEHLVAWINPFV
jgi:hypothetical protein